MDHTRHVGVKYLAGAGVGEDDQIIASVVPFILR
jgi:hypothetical protein